MTWKVNQNDSDTHIGKNVADMVVRGEFDLDRQQAADLMNMTDEADMMSSWTRGHINLPGQALSSGSAMASGSAGRAPEQNTPQPKPKAKATAKKAAKPSAGAQAMLRKVSDLMTECKSWDSKLKAVKAPANVTTGFMQDLRVFETRFQDMYTKLQDIIAAGHADASKYTPVVTLAQTLLDDYSQASELVRRFCTAKPKAAAKAKAKAKAKAAA